MRRLLLSICLAAGTIAGAGCDSSTKPSCAIAIAAGDQNRTIGPGASQFSVGVVAPSGCGWSASATGGFLTITSGASGTGNGTIEVSAAANDSVVRLGTVVAGSATASVTQQAADGSTCAFAVTPATASVPAAGGTVAVAITVSVGTNCNWTAATSAGFIGIAPLSGSGNGTVTLTVAPNSGVARTGDVVVAGRSISVEQAAFGPAPCSYDLSPGVTSVGVSGGTLTYTMTTGPTCTWQPAVIQIGGTTYLAIIDPGLKTGSGSFHVQAAANPGMSLLGQVSAGNVVRTIVQDENPGVCQVSVTPASLSLTSAAQTASFTVNLVTGNSTLCPITANPAFVPGQPTFITTSFIQSSSGATPLQVSVSANTGTVRTNTVQVKWGWKIEGDTVVQAYVVNAPVSQDAPPPAQGSVIKK